MSREYKIPKDIKTEYLVRGIINASYWEWHSIDVTQHTEAIKYLNNLEAIDNANPSKTLECFYKIDNTINLNWKNHFLRVGIDIYNRSDCDDEKEMANCLATIKQALLKEQENKKVLEIIFEKGVEMALFNDSKTVEDYNRNRNWGAKELTQEELDLLKRYFK